MKQGNTKQVLTGGRQDWAHGSSKGSLVSHLFRKPLSISCGLKPVTLQMVVHITGVSDSWLPLSGSKRKFHSCTGPSNQLYLIYDALAGSKEISS